MSAGSGAGIGPGEGIVGKIVTIDGPAGAGKTTVSKALATSLGWVYVDTGALYRAVAYEIDRQDVQWKDPQVLGSFLQNLDIGFDKSPSGLAVISSGQDITKKIRTPEISMLASTTSALPGVRKALLGIQRGIAQSQDAVFEGRDMGTVVFPHAQVKFFLFADLLVRARRRFREMSDPSRDIHTVKRELQLRDEQDASRALAPLKPAGDAVHIDASCLTVDQVVEKMLREISQRIGKFF